ncbi:MAG: YraN family protein [Pirellulaceae bacterium]
MLNPLQKFNFGQRIAFAGRFFGHCLTFFSLDRRDGLGPAGEREAAKFLRKLGYRIVAHSHRQRLGEIDLIAIDDGCVVFVEVKTWNSDSNGDPSLAVDRRKQEKITRAALIFLKAKGLLEHPARFDVVSIVLPTTRGAHPVIRHFKSAFEAVGNMQMYR